MKSTSVGQLPRALNSAGGSLTRRTFLIGAPVALAGCQTVGTPSPVMLGMAARIEPANATMYAAMPDERFPIPGVDVSNIDPRFLRQEVDDPTGERPGTIVVDTAGPYLYWVREKGRALRYGIGVGREGFSWSGRARILMKREWPKWTPPAEMIARQPELEPYRHGMQPGLDNPLGARALYLFEGGRDTLYRIHGTSEPWSIGTAASSGCIRLFNQDIIDLYGRVPEGTDVVVLTHKPDIDIG